MQKVADRILKRSARVKFLSSGIIVIGIILVCIPFNTEAQNFNKRMLRVYLDNDLFAYQKKDGAYTNGLRADYFFESRRRGKLFKKKLRPVAGVDATNTHSIGLMQIMITPNSIKTVSPSRKDYPYSGSLLLNHTFNSFNPQQKRSVQTEYIIGLMGPWSFASQTQSGVHRLINNHRPMGWSSQYPTAWLFNFNVSTEQQVAGCGNYFEAILKGQIDIGTMLRATSVQAILRIGRMTPYFENSLGQFIAGREKGYIVYGFFKSQTQWVMSNALLQGVPSHQISQSQEDNSNGQRTIAPIVFNNDLGIVFSYNRFGISLTYKTHSGLLHHQPPKGFGNISFYASL